MSETPSFYGKVMRAALKSGDFTTQEAMLSTIASLDLHYDAAGEIVRSKKTAEYIKNHFSYDRFLDTLRGNNDEL